MTPEILLALGLGVVATYLTALVKRFLPSLSSRETQLIAFGVCFLVALIVAIIRQYAPPEALATVGTAFTTAIAWYEVVAKRRD